LIGYIHNKPNQIPTLDIRVQPDLGYQLQTEEHSSMKYAHVTTALITFTLTARKWVLE